MYDLTPPTACFCGCGRSMGFGSVRLINGVGQCLAADVEVLRAAAAGDEEVAALLRDAEPLWEMLREVLHGDRSNDTLDRDALRAWWGRALPIRDRVAGTTRPADASARYSARQLATLHELGALSENQFWARSGMAR
jgi:hypothetical protein